jgi:predicted transcriptional regulator
MIRLRKLHFEKWVDVLIYCTRFENKEFYISQIYYKVELTHSCLFIYFVEMEKIGFIINLGMKGRTRMYKLTPKGLKYGLYMSEVNNAIKDSDTK